jgi:hypothetical protein
MVLRSTVKTCPVALKVPSATPQALSTNSLEPVNDATCDRHTCSLPITTWGFNAIISLSDSPKAGTAAVIIQVMMSVIVFFIASIRLSD